MLATLITWNPWMPVSSRFPVSPLALVLPRKFLVSYPPWEVLSVPPFLLQRILTLLNLLSIMVQCPFPLLLLGSIGLAILMDFLLRVLILLLSLDFLIISILASYLREHGKGLMAPPLLEA